MKYLKFVLFCTISANALAAVKAAVVGETVCVEGLVMDTLCIDLGNLLDNPAIATLEQPGEHSFHCLLDVDQCIESGYTILKEPENEDSNYTVAYSLDDAGTQTIVQIGRAAGPVGMCETCTGSGDLMKGLRAEVRGVVTSIGSDDEPPTITVTTATVSNGRSDFCGPTTSINTTTDPNVTTPTKNPQTNSGASDYVTGCITNVVGMLLFSGLTAFVL